MLQAETKGLPPQDYDQMIVGTPLGPIDVTVDDELARSYAYTVDDFNPWCLWDQGSPFGGRIAPPVAIAVRLLRLWSLVYDATTDRSLHAKEEFRLYKPIRIGQRVTLKGRVADKYIKRDRQWVVYESEALAEDGHPLMWARAVEMLGMQPGLKIGAGTATAPSSGGSSRKSAACAADLPVATRAHLDVPIGSPLPSLTKRPDRKQMWVFSAREGRWDNMHTDRTTATSIGLEDIIGQGLMTTGYLSELCANFFGPAWFSSAWVLNAFLKPVYIDDTLSVKGVVSNRLEEADGPRLEVEFWCENQHGDTVTAGRAHARVQ